MAGQAASFPDARTGVRAQIQHLKAYASKDALKRACIDPRFALVSRGSAPYVEWLGVADNPSGKGWANPGNGYGGKIMTLLAAILAYEVPKEPEAAPAAPAVPEWQTDGLRKLTDAGVINSPEVWEKKLGDDITVGETFGILGKMYDKVAE